MSSTDHLDYDGTLIMRVVARGVVQAQAIMADTMPEAQQQAIAEEHERVARRWLASGHLVELEARNLDGSLFGLTLLAPDGDGGPVVVGQWEADTLLDELDP